MESMTAQEEEWRDTQGGIGIDLEIQDLFSVWNLWRDALSGSSIKRSVGRSPVAVALICQVFIPTSDS